MTAINPWVPRDRQRDGSTHFAANTNEHRGSNEPTQSADGSEAKGYGWKMDKELVATSALDNLGLLMEGVRRQPWCQYENREITSEAKTITMATRTWASSACPHTQKIS